MTTYSVIIPCYNESRRIEATISEIKNFLDNHPGSEAIFVDDGSRDDTISRLRTRCQHDERIKIVSKILNEGKWSAIKIGAQVACKDYWVLSDADYSVDLSLLDRLHLDEDDIVVIGDRYHKGNSIPLIRYVVSRCFNKLTKIVAGLKYNDSQTPFKVCRIINETDAAMRLVKENGFAGDVDFLKACEAKKISVRVVGIRYHHEEGSTVNIKKHAYMMFKALLEIRKRWDKYEEQTDSEEVESAEEYKIVRQMQ